MIPPDTGEPFDHSIFESSVADLEDVLAVSPVVLYSAALDGERIVPLWVSRNIGHILGYDVDEALADGWWWRNVHPDDRERASASGRVLLAQRQYAHEYRFRHFNGAYIWMLDQMRIVVRGSSDPTIVGSWTDVSATRAQQERLESAEAHYRRLIRTSPYSIFTVDAAGRVTEINPAGERILGRTDMLGMSFTDLIAPADLERAGAFFEQILTGTADSYEIELHVSRRDGEDRLLSISVAPIRDSGVIGAHGIARDITEERRVGLERERARQQYERLVTTSPYAIYALDLEGRFTEVSEATAELLGRSVDELIGMPFSSIVAPEDLPKATESFQRRIRGEIETSELDLHIIRKDGERRLAHIRATEIRDGERVLGSHGIGRDITEERAHEERMRMLAAALDQLPDGVCVADERHRLLYANSAFFRLLGGDPDTVSDCNIFAESIGAGGVYAAMQEGLRTEGAWRGTFMRDGTAGDPLPIEVIADHVTVDEQTLTYAVLRDLTEEVTREQQLRRAERLASVGTLVAGVAHELNNPLTAIAGFAELMLMEPHSDDDREMLQLTMREATRAAKIVADLRLIARETQQSAPSRGAVDLNDVVLHALKLQRYTLDTSNIEVDADLADDLPRVHANAGELEQVVLNLLMNARQALEERHEQRRRIFVRTRPVRGGVMLRIADNGPGIPQDYIERIFDPFFTTKAPGEGLGLGLSLVHRIITEHAGQLQVESAPGEGTAFTVSLPRARVAATPPDATVSVLPRHLHILVVDDEESIRRALVRFLTRRGHSADVAGDGRAALLLIGSHRYDIILTDLRMPGMGGELLLDTLRERDPRAARRVMFMTGHVARDDEALQAAYADVPMIEKPFSLNELGSRLEELAARLRDERP